MTLAADGAPAIAGVPMVNGVPTVRISTGTVAADQRSRGGKLTPNPHWLHLELGC